MTSSPMYNLYAKGIVGQTPIATDNTDAVIRLGRSTQLIVDQLRGQYAEECSRGNVYNANAAAITLPVNANNLAGKFVLLNPVGSGKYLELIDADISTVLATTVVDSVGLYGMAVPGLGTLTAVATQNGLIGNGASGVGIFYSAATFTGTPLLYALLGGWGAVTDGSLNNVHYPFNGKVLVAPGAAVTLAMTTAASTASGITAGMSWIERPI